MIDRVSSSDFRWLGCLDGNTVWNEDTEAGCSHHHDGLTSVWAGAPPCRPLSTACPSICICSPPPARCPAARSSAGPAPGRTRRPGLWGTCAWITETWERCQEISSVMRLSTVAVWSIIWLCLRWVISSLISPSSPNCLQSPHLKLSKQICLSGLGALW